MTKIYSEDLINRKNFARGKKSYNILQPSFARYNIV